MDFTKLCFVAGWITRMPKIRKDAFLFGKGQSRVLISYEVEHEEAILRKLSKTGVDFNQLGSVANSPSLTVDQTGIIEMPKANAVYEDGFSKNLS